MGQGQILSGKGSSGTGGLGAIMQMINSMGGSKEADTSVNPNSVGNGTIDNYSSQKSYAPGSNMPGPYAPQNPTQGPPTPETSHAGGNYGQPSAMSEKLTEQNHMQTIQNGQNLVNDPSVDMDYGLREEAFKHLAGVTTGITQRKGQGGVKSGSMQQGPIGQVVGTVAALL